MEIEASKQFAELSVEMMEEQEKKYLANAICEMHLFPHACGHSRVQRLSLSLDQEKLKEALKKADNSKKDDEFRRRQ